MVYIVRTAQGYPVSWVTFGKCTQGPKYFAIKTCFKIAYRDSVGERVALADLVQRPPEKLPAAGLLGPVWAVVAVLRVLADGMPLRPLRHPPEHVLQLDRRLHLRIKKKDNCVFNIKVTSHLRVVCHLSDTKSWKSPTVLFYIFLRTQELGADSCHSPS